MRSEEVRAIRADRIRVASLLDRYPRINAHETDEILTFLHTARNLDIGLLTANRGIQPNLDAFMAANRAEFDLKLHPGTAIAMAIGSALAVLGLIGVAFA
jgi:hypothetical protein